MTQYKVLKAEPTRPGWSKDAVISLDPNEAESYLRGGVLGPVDEAKPGVKPGPEVRKAPEQGQAAEDDDKDEPAGRSPQRATPPGSRR